MPAVTHLQQRPVKQCHAGQSCAEQWRSHAAAQEVAPLTKPPPLKQPVMLRFSARVGIGHRGPTRSDTAVAASAAYLHASAASPAISEHDAAGRLLASTTPLVVQVPLKMLIGPGRARPAGPLPTAVLPVAMHMAMKIEE